MSKKTDKDKLFERMGLINPDRKVLNENMLSSADSNGLAGYTENPKKNQEIDNNVDLYQKLFTLGKNNEGVNSPSFKEFENLLSQNHISPHVIYALSNSNTLEEFMEKINNINEENDGGFGIGTSPEVDDPTEEVPEKDEDDIIYRDNEAEPNEDDFLESVRSVIKEFDGEDKDYGYYMAKEKVDDEYVNWICQEFDLQPETVRSVAEISGYDPEETYNTLNDEVDRKGYGFDGINDDDDEDDFLEGVRNVIKEYDGGVQNDDKTIIPNAIKVISLNPNAIEFNDKTIK